MRLKLSFAILVQPAIWEDKSSDNAIIITPKWPDNDIIIK